MCNLSYKNVTRRSLCGFIIVFFFLMNINFENFTRSCYMFYNEYMYILPNGNLIEQFSGDSNQLGKFFEGISPTVNFFIIFFFLTIFYFWWFSIWWISQTRQRDGIDRIACRCHGVSHNGLKRDYGHFLRYWDMNHCAATLLTFSFRFPIMASGSLSVSPATSDVSDDFIRFRIRRSYSLGSRPGTATSQTPRWYRSANE